MIIATVSEFRANMKAFLAQVKNNIDTLIINQGKGNAYVLMTMEEFNAIKATEYLLSTEANRESLRRSRKQVQKAQLHQIEFMDDGSFLVR